MLATIEKIEKIEPHTNADKLELAIVKGWRTVIRKGDYKEGDSIIFVQIDTILPFAPWSEFLRDKNRPERSIRVKTIKLRGEISQGLVLPKSILPEGNYEIGTDVAEILGITKYEKEVDASMRGESRSNFPSHLISKTDEERIQNIPRIIEELQGLEVAITEKLDGTSATFLKESDIYHVCSRKISLVEDENNKYWKIYKENNIKEFLNKNPNLSIQGEIIGAGIQGNKYNLPNIELRIFNFWDIIEKKYLNEDALEFLCATYNFKRVPLLERRIFNFKSVEELLEYAKGKSVLYDTIREGIVIRTIVEKYSETLRGRTSFKVINNDFALQNGE